MRGGLSLSALVVAHNEEAQLAGCLPGSASPTRSSSCSTAAPIGSREIARRFTDRVVEGAWEREGPRRNAGIAACRGDWILEIDADERVEPGARGRNPGGRREFAGGLAPDPGRQLYRRPARALGLGRFVRQLGPCRAVPPAAPSSWGDERVHPASRLSGQQGSDARRAARPSMSIATSPTCCAASTAIPARGRRICGTAAISAAIGHNLRRIVSRFWKCYVGRRGYREGPYGFLIALCAALYPILSYLKARLETRTVMASVVMADDGIAFDGTTAETGPLGGAETAFVALAEALGGARPSRRGAQPLPRRARAITASRWAPLAGGVPASLRSLHRQSRRTG